MSENNKISLSEWSSEERPLPPPRVNEDYGDYFRRLLTEWSYRAKEAEKVHERWRTKLEWSGGVRESDCTYRIFIVLKELMDSAFLKDDYIDTGIPKVDREQAQKELESLGFGELCQMEGADWKFALLTRHLRKQGESRLIIDEKMAGFYIEDVREKITEDAAEAFFRFATFMRLAYQEIDRLKKDNSDREFDECLAKMLTDLEPLRDHVVSDFDKNFEFILDDILRVGDLQKKLKQVSPNTFKGGYNQKLTCNLVGLLCGEGIYDVNPKQADGLIYIGKTHYTYINNYAASDSNSELTREDINNIKAVIKSYI